LTLSVPDEGYSRNAWYALNLISTFLLLHNYSISSRISQECHNFSMLEFDANILNAGYFVL